MPASGAPSYVRPSHGPMGHDSGAWPCAGRATTRRLMELENLPLAITMMVGPQIMS
jgi:hypothetical protein